MNINRKQIMETFIGIIGHISDKEYQKRVWIRAEGPECDDFDETCCHFFDMGDHILEQYKDYAITEIQHQLLKEFRDQFEEFSDAPGHYHPIQFIDSPEWERIMTMAKEVLKAFESHKWE